MPARQYVVDIIGPIEYFSCIGRNMSGGTNTCDVMKIMKRRHLVVGDQRQRLQSLHKTNAINSSHRGASTQAYYVGGVEEHGAAAWTRQASRAERSLATVFDWSRMQETAAAAAAAAAC